MNTTLTPLQQQGMAAKAAARTLAIAGTAKKNDAPFVKCRKNHYTYKG